jgi:large subunit ribosomal protein L18
MTKLAKKKREDRLRRHARVRAVISGTADRPRLNVFRSSANIYAQVIDDSVGHTMVAASTIDKEVAAQIEGKTKSEAAKVVGVVLAARAKAAGITRVVFDRGGYRYFGRVSALAEGAREGGLEF